MGSSFDPFAWESSFYFKGMTRDEASSLLSEEGVPVGTFLLRDSRKDGNISISVREFENEPFVRHYLIESEKVDGVTKVYKIASHEFDSMPSLLNHFKLRILDQASLMYPYRKRAIERVMALYRFEGVNDSDLSFERGEELEIIEKQSDEWWEARNALNCIGHIPATYVGPVDTPLDENGFERDLKGRSQTSYCSSTGGEERFSGISSSSNNENMDERPYEPILPAVAKVIFDRIPNVYDPQQLKIKKGQKIRITKKLMNGMYEGELEGKVGMVPHTYVRFPRPNVSEERD